MATYPANGSNVDTWDAALLAWLTDTVFDVDGSFKAESEPTFAALSLSGLTENRLLAGNGDKELVSTALASWMAGTTNQITVTDDGDGTVTLSGPQDLHSTATPQFAKLGLGKAPAANILQDSTWAITDTGGTVYRNLYAVLGLNPPANSAAYLRGSEYYTFTQNVAHNFTGYIAGLWSRCKHNGTGTLSTQYGLVLNVQNGNTGTVTYQYGILMNNENDGTVGTYRGINHSYDTAGGNPNIAHFIYDSSGFDSYFSGSIGIDKTSPAAKLDVVGDARFGDGTTNYAEFKSDGELNLHGTARVEQAIWIDSNGIKAPGAKPATEVAHGDLEVAAWQFANEALETNQQSVSWSCRIPEPMDRTVAPTISIAWSADGVSPGNCEWQLEYFWTSPGESTVQGAEETLTQIAAASSTSNGMVLTTFTGINVPSGSDVCLHCRLTRLSAGANDTIADTVELHGTCFQFTCDKLGKAT